MKIIVDEVVLLFLKENKINIKKEFDPLIDYFKEEQKSYLESILDLVIDYDVLEQIQNKNDYINNLIKNE